VGVGVGGLLASENMAIVLSFTLATILLAIIIIVVIICLSRQHQHHRGRSGAGWGGGAHSSCEPNINNSCKKNVYYDDRGGVSHDDVMASRYMGGASSQTYTDSNGNGVAGTNSEKLCQPMTSPRGGLNGAWLLSNGNRKAAMNGNDAYVGLRGSDEEKRGTLGDHSMTSECNGGDKTMQTVLVTSAVHQVSLE